ncbi:MAG: adenylate/guanylate cyclase domain-containing protein [Rhodospirillales bacterium]|nr:MAG: adenylate/guanylate cyclase domain-containing protein [Rhodospirillales bacterium]
MKPVPFADRVSAWLTDGGRDAAPPERVLAAIRAQQERSEILVGWIQLALVCFFATLVASFDMAEGIVQADWSIEHQVVGAYLALTIARIWLAHARRLRAWMLYVSVLADVVLLMTVIWSFHLKYAQPAAFYLKAPTLLYVFIFIALRALRFEARFVLFAGAAGAAGWAAMLWYALSGHGGPPNRTRNFIEYVTSNATLVGAEIDKIIAILLVTAILALAITRARRLLIRATTESAAAMDLSRFLDPAVARRIRGSEVRIAPGSGEARDVTILTTDLRGFTRLSSDLSPDEVMRLLNDYQARICPAIQAAGGSIDKFLGDGILASFGAATPGGTYAADALRAADAVTAAVDAWNAERSAAGLPAVRVGMALASGRVLFGAVGDGDRLEYTVIGDAVNLAAKLEKHTKAENVRALCDVATWDGAAAQGYAAPGGRERRAARTVAGVAAPVDLIVLSP